LFAHINIFQIYVIILWSFFSSRTQKLKSGKSRPEKGKGAGQEDGKDTRCEFFSFRWQIFLLGKRSPSWEFSQMRNMHRGSPRKSKEKFFTQENIASYEPRARARRKNKKLLEHDEGKVCE
jgi:hypothetical protein